MNRDWRRDLGRDPPEDLLLLDERAFRVQVFDLLVRLTVRVAQLEDWVAGWEDPTPKDIVE
jgi:hypothetical protein